MIKEENTNRLIHSLENCLAGWAELAGSGSQTEEAHYARGVVYGLQHSLDLIKIFNDPSQ